MNRIHISRRTLSILAVLVPLVGLLGYVALRSGPLAPIAVTLVEVKDRALRPSVFGVGHVEARQVHRIGPTAPGRVARINVEVGDTVKVGQILGEMEVIDNDDRLRSQEALVRRSAAVLEDAMARHAHASTQAHRYEQLFAEKATSQELLEARRQDLKVASALVSAAREDTTRAQSDLQALRSVRSNLRLISPINGIVTSREADPGTTVVAGQTVIEVIDPKTLWINTRFDQISAGGLTASQPAQISLRSRRGQVIEGQVKRTEWRADAVTEEMLAKVAFSTSPNPLPPIGERAEVTVYLPEMPEGPVIPNAAVQRIGKQIGVWVAKGEGVAFVPIKLGLADLDGHVQVLEGLKTGESVVLYSDKALNERSRIHVVQRQPGVAS